MRERRETAELQVPDVVGAQGDLVSRGMTGKDAERCTDLLDRAPTNLIRLAHVRAFLVTNDDGEAGDWLRRFRYLPPPVESTPCAGGCGRGLTIRSRIGHRDAATGALWCMPCGFNRRAN